MPKRLDIAVRAIAAAGAIASLAAQDSTQFTDAAAADLFRYSRMAVTGGGNIGRLRALSLKGRSRFVVNERGDLTGAVVDIKLLLPDHYLRIDTAGTSQKTAGYAGKTVLSSMHDGASVSYPPDQLRQTILQNERQRVARLLLGAITYVGGDLPMTFSSVPQSIEFVDPRINPRTSMAVNNSTAEPYTALVSGAHFSARFIVDGKNRTPAHIVFVGADKKPVTMTFEDRRSVDGLQLPFHIVTTIDGHAIDDLVFDEILVNPELSKADFKKQ